MDSDKNKLFNSLLNSRMVEFVPAGAQLILTLITVGLLLLLNVLPTRYFVAVVVVLVLISFPAFFTQITKHGRMAGKIFAIIICLVLTIGNIYLYKTHSTLVEVADTVTKVDNFSVIVLKENPAQSVQDAVYFNFGVLEGATGSNGEEVIQKINVELNTEIATAPYADFTSQVDALYNKKVDAIIFNEAYRDIIKETHADFDDKTKILGEQEVETEVKIDSTTEKVDAEPFNVYISGIDTYGDISRTSRSDVNIIVTVNPVTKKILLTTTPRDYFVTFPNSGGMKDKLTHAGIYGVDVSIGTLANLYDTDISYYARVNFNTLVNMVDALGGITVNSEYAFNVKGYSFKKGENRLNGEEALAFSRERYSFSSGDNQRGRNQMEVIKGMIGKAISPAIITNYTKILDSVAESIQTNMSSSDITNLVKMQLNDMSTWDIQTNYVTGTGTRSTTFSCRSEELYVMIPDQQSVEAAKFKIQQVLIGN